MIFLYVSALLLSIATPLSIALDHIAIAIGLLGLILRVKRIKLRDLDFRVLGVSGVGFLSSIFSVDPLKSVKKSHYLWHFLPYFILSRLDRSRIKTVIVVLGISFIVSSLAVIFQAFTGLTLNSKLLHQLNHLHFFSTPIRSKGVFSAYLTTAGILAPITLLFFSLSFFERKRLRVFFISVAVIGFIALILNFSRSYWIGTLTAVLVMPFYYFKKKSFAFVPVVAVVMAFCLYQFVPSINRRVKTIINYKKDVSAMDRIALWKAGLNLYNHYDLKRKLIGCGSGNLFGLLKPYLRSSVIEVFGTKNIGSHFFSSVHNEYLQILLKWGIVGLLVWFYLWGYVLYRNFLFLKETDNEFYRGLVLGLTMGFLAFLVGGFFEHNVGDAEVIILIMFLLGINKNILDSLEGVR